VENNEGEDDDVDEGEPFPMDDDVPRGNPGFGPPDDDDDVFEDAEDDDEPLFTGDDAFNQSGFGDGTTTCNAQFRSDVTFEEIIGALLVLKTCHKMSWSLFLSIISFVQALLVTDCKIFPKTHAQLKTFFKNIHGVGTKRVCYCITCDKIVKILPDMMDRPADLFCDQCGRDVAEDVNKYDRGTFIYIPFLPQLRAYVRNGNLYKVVKEFMDKATTFFRGEWYRGVIERGNIPVMVGSDAAPLTKSSSKGVYPLVVSLECIPHQLKQRFALISACFAGKKVNEPPVHLLYNFLKAELKLFSTKAINWARGETKNVELIAVGGDQPEMRKLANQTTLGYRSCLYCLVRGTWDGTAVRFGLKHHEDPMRERTAEHRKKCAHIADRLNEENPNLHPDRQNRRSGVFGLPLFGESPSFHITWSYVLDMMHVALLGFLRDIVDSMCGGSSLDHHLKRSEAQGFQGNALCLLINHSFFTVTT
jgi:hypothetical protein